MKEYPIRELNYSRMRGVLLYAAQRRLDWEGLRVSNEEWVEEMSLLLYCGQQPRLAAQFEESAELPVPAWTGKF